MSKVVKKAKKLIQKVIPKEIKPFVAPIAAYYLGPMALKSMGGAGLTGVKGFLARAAASGVTSAATQKLVEDDVSKSSTLISALSGGLGAGYGGQGAQTAQGIRAAKTVPMGDFDKISMLDKAKNIGLEGIAKATEMLTPTTGKGIATLVGTAGAASGIEKEMELLDQYNQSLTEQGIEDKSERISLIRKYMANAGFDESQVTDALGRYGYLANGGRVGYEEGGSVEKTPSDIFIEMYQQGKYDTLQGAIEDADRYQRGETTDYEKLTGRKPFQEGGDVSYTDYGRSGVIYMDQDGNPISKEKFLEETDKEEGIPSIRMKEEPKTLKDLLEDPDAVKEMLRQNKKEGGIMNLKGREMDLRGGGFVPIGAKERADDVPARLSKNEFVFTADAVRGAGNGDVDRGAQKMYNTMKMLEGKLA